MCSSPPGLSPVCCSGGRETCMRLRGCEKPMSERRGQRQHTDTETDELRADRKRSDGAQSYPRKEMRQNTLATSHAPTSKAPHS
eukprot:scaffold36311_cov119-Isochrysis_galbana.AAC.5